jgi:ligand-binding SRPBCC domain-containing protein
MATYIKSVLIHAPLETVFEFHERPDALTLLSPAFPPLRVLRKDGGLEPGARVELRVGFVRWVAMHTAYERNRMFVDEQIEGPFAKWIHRHEFESVGEMTRLTDRVEYLLPGGAIVNLAAGWMVRIGLAGMFRDRHRTTKQLCEMLSK